MQIYFCILHEISMKLQKTNTKKIEKTATRGSSFQFVRGVTHFQLRRKLRHNLVHA